MDDQFDEPERTAHLVTDPKGVMAPYERTETNTTLVEFVVPAPAGVGACWVEVMKAIRTAHNELWEQGRVPQGIDASGDTIRLYPGDGTVIVFYEREATT